MLGNITSLNVHIQVVAQCAKINVGHLMRGYCEKVGVVPKAFSQCNFYFHEEVNAYFNLPGGVFLKLNALKISIQHRPNLVLTSIQVEPPWSSQFPSYFRF